MKEMKELTKAELQLMNLLWDRGEAFVNDLLADLPEPKPAYNTVSTVMRLLVTKGFVSYRAYGKSHQYYPLVSREEYLDSFMSSVKKSFFRDSFVSLVSFFAKKENLTSSEIDDLMKILNENKKKD